MDDGEVPVGGISFCGVATVCCCGSGVVAVGCVRWGAITEYFEERFVVDCYDEVCKPKDKEPCFVEGICHGQGLALDGGVSGLG